MRLEPAPPPGHALGIFDGTHDAGAALVVDGRLVAAASEERSSRKKGAGGWPEGAIAACLRVGGLSPADLATVAREAHERPLQKGEALFQQGEEAVHNYVMGWGRLRLDQTTPDGQNLVLR